MHMAPGCKGGQAHSVPTGVAVLVAALAQGAKLRTPSTPKFWSHGVVYLGPCGAPALYGRMPYTHRAPWSLPFCVQADDFGIQYKKMVLPEKSAVPTGPAFADERLYEQEAATSEVQAYLAHSTRGATAGGCPCPACPAFVSLCRPGRVRRWM